MKIIRVGDKIHNLTDALQIQIFRDNRGGDRKILISYASTTKENMYGSIIEIPRPDGLADEDHLEQLRQMLNRIQAIMED